MSEKCTTDFDVSGMSCSACQAAVERAVKKAGADDVSVNLLSGRMKVTHSDALSLEAIMEAVTAAGYHAEPHDTSQLTKAPQESAEEVNKRHRIVSSVILLIPLMIVAMLPMMPFAPDALLHSTLWLVASPLIQLVLALVILIINRAYFTMVALDENDKPKPVPRLIVESESEKAEWEAAKKRREMRLRRKEEGY